MEMFLRIEYNMVVFQIVYPGMIQMNPLSARFSIQCSVLDSLCFLHFELWNSQGDSSTFNNY